MFISVPRNEVFYACCTVKKETVKWQIVVFICSKLQCLSPKATRPHLQIRQHRAREPGELVGREPDTGSKGCKLKSQQIRQHRAREPGELVGREPDTGSQGCKLKSQQEQWESFFSGVNFLR